jgi:hypothetical protein
MVAGGRLTDWISLGVLTYVLGSVDAVDDAVEVTGRRSSRQGERRTGTDCGIGSQVGHEEAVWAKLRAMARGCELASKQLWGKWRKDGRMTYELLVKDAAVRSSRFSREGMCHETKY